MRCLTFITLLRTKVFVVYTCLELVFLNPVAVSVFSLIDDDSSSLCLAVTLCFIFLPVEAYNIFSNQEAEHF